MNAETFAYWLQGALEMSPEMLENGMTPEQVQTIQDHLNLVFNKVTPDRFNKDDIPVKIEDVQPFHWNPDSTGNPPLIMPGTVCSDGSDLFCSKINANSNLEPNIIESMNISGCSNISLTDDITGIMDDITDSVSEDEEEWTGGSTLLSSC